MSTLRVDTINDRVGTGQPAISGLAKAWVNFNGTGTVAIRGQYNVASITDNGTGNYTVNFTTAMSDANYASFALGKQTDNTTVGGAQIEGASPSASSLRILTANASFAAADFVFVSVAIHR